MSMLACPYCTNPLVNDGSLAGQLVQCPRCGGQMQMPGIAAPPVPPPINPALSGFEVTSSGPSVRSSYQQSKRQSGPDPIFLWGTILLVAVALIAIFVLASSEISSGPTEASAYSNGYEHGHQNGKINRNFGKDVSASSEFSDFVVETRWGYLKDQKIPLPETGTREFGDFREGFIAGYRDGFAGR